MPAQTEARPSPSSIRTRRRRRLIRQGAWNPATDVTTIREHIQKLREAGMTITAISAASGVPTSTFDSILYEPDRVYVIGDNAAAILAVTPPPAPAPRHDQVVATGTIRRLQALAAIGWTCDILGKHLNAHTTNVSRWMWGRHPFVAHTTAQAVTDLYRRLADADGPSVRVRKAAERRGWLPPVAWDDDEIDDPNARPHLDDAEPTDFFDWYAVELVIAGKRGIKTLTSLAERQHVVTVLQHERGMDVQAVATRVGTSDDVVQRIVDSLDPAKQRHCIDCNEALQTLNGAAKRCHDCSREHARRDKIRRRTETRRRQRQAAKRQREQVAA